MAHAVLTLDDLNVGVVTIKDREGRTRFTIAVANMLRDDALVLDINAWDGDNFGTPNERHEAVAFSFNTKASREPRASRKES